MLEVRTKLHTPMPEARIAVTSLSAARRLRPSSTPTSTAMGTENTNRLGSVNSTMVRTEPMELLLRIISSSK